MLAIFAQRFEKVKLALRDCSFSPKIACLSRIFESEIVDVEDEMVAVLGCACANNGYNASKCCLFTLAWRC
jgi:hypothetical protein